jgi:hypothetical protein
MIRNSSSSSPLFFLEFENAARTDDEALLLANKMPITNIIQRSIHSTIFSSYSCSFPLALIFDCRVTPSSCSSKSSGTT